MKAPVSAENTFYTAETPKVYQIFTTDNMLWTGGNGTGLSYCLKYADDSTDENPVVLAKGVDENRKEFEQRIYINDVDPSNATVVEMRALEAHYKVEKQGGFTSLPLEAGNMGLNDRRDFISMFKECIEDLNKLGRFDLSLIWTKNMDAYLDLTSANSKYKQCLVIFPLWLCTVTTFGIENENRTLDQEEQKKFRKQALIILVLADMAIIISYKIHIEVCQWLLNGMIVAALLNLCGKNFIRNFSIGSNDFMFKWNKCQCGNIAVNTRKYYIRK